GYVLRARRGPSSSSAVSALDMNYPFRQKRDDDGPEREARLRREAPDLHFRVPAQARATVDVRRLLRDERRRSPHLDDGGAREGEGHRTDSRSERLRARREVAAHLPPALRAGGGGERLPDDGRRHDEGRGDHVGPAASRRSAPDRRGKGPRGAPRGDPAYAGV